MNVQKIKQISSIFQSREGKNKLKLLKSICKEVLFFGVAQVCRSWFYMVRNMYRRWYVNYLLAKYGTVLAGDSTLTTEASILMNEILTSRPNAVLLNKLYLKSIGREFWSQSRAQSLNLSLATLVLPDVNFYVHCRNFRQTAENCRAQFIILGASFSKEKVKNLIVPRLYVIFSLLPLFQSRDW